MNFRNIIAFIIGLWLATLICRCHHSTESEQPLRDTIVDTIKVVKPIAVDSVVTRYKWVNVERVKDTTIVNEVSEVVFDTIRVRLPIESKHYTAESYDAWVSGYEPQLDSIKVYNREVIVKVKKSRWSVGVQGGVGLTPKGVQPYIGVGIGYRLK